jgi:DNA-binding transcriptional LysR family regulator
MQFESLKVFCDVARQRSFSQAAQANDLTQSAVSQVVLQLEKRLGVQLVNRSTRPLQLTELGRVYYEGCKVLVEQYLELEASVRSAQARLDVTVQVAAIYSVGLGDLGRYVERFAALQPEARVQVEYLHPDRVYERVGDGSADLGLVSFPRRSAKLLALPWREEEMVLACPPGHALARNLAVQPAQLQGEKFVAFCKGLSVRREVDRFLRDHGVAVEVAMEFDNIESIKKAVEIASGVALLPEPTLQREVRARTLVAVPLYGVRLVRPLGIIYARHHHLSTAALRFIDLLRQGCADGAAPVPFADGARPRARANGSHRSRNGAARSSRKDR